MTLRPTTLVLMSCGLIVVVGIGCQSSREFRAAQAGLLPRLQAAEPRTNSNDDRPVPAVDETELEAQEQLLLPPEPESPTTSAPNERPLPVPPADTEPAPQARRWFPARPRVAATQVPQVSNTSDSDDLSLPPARVIYDTTDVTDDESTITPAPDHTAKSQPRLFRPAGSVKNLFEAMRRKLSRPDSSR